MNLSSLSNREVDIHICTSISRLIWSLELICSSEKVSHEASKSGGLFFFLMTYMTSGQNAECCLKSPPLAPGLYLHLLHPSGHQKETKLGLQGLRLPSSAGQIRSHVQFSSVAQSCPTLCDPMDCSTPGLPVHHQLPEFTQTHVH